MNLPNKLTVFRVCMIPLFLVAFFWKSLPLNYLWSAVIFGIAAITDALDGHIARKFNLVTDFGKLMDPLADKLLVISALVCILGGGYFQMINNAEINQVICLVSLVMILAREFLVTSIRLVAANKGIVIAADGWGKLKTIVQMIWIPLVLLGIAIPWHNFPLRFDLIFLWAVNILFVAMILLTVGSGFNYVWKNRNLIADA